MFSMAKRTVFTTVTALPGGITRQCVMETLYNHFEMIDLNPLVIERHPIKPPNYASPEEYNCRWYQLTDVIRFLPGGLYSHKITYNACFHGLSDGLQTHVYAPLGLDIKGKWTLGGSLLGEPRKPVEMGHDIPMNGLWLREDIDMRCNILMTDFVKSTLRTAHATLVERLLVKAQLLEAELYNARLQLHKQGRTLIQPKPLTLPLRNATSTRGIASPSQLEIGPANSGQLFSNNVAKSAEMVGIRMPPTRQYVTDTVNLDKTSPSTLTAPFELSPTELEA